MTWTSLKVAATVVMALGIAAPLEAQGRGNGRDRDDDDRYEQRDDDHRYGDRQGVRGGRKDDDARRRRAERRDDDRDDDRWDRDYGQRERGNGPAFCRSGAGHPVFGWDWCRDRGWDRSNSRYPVQWERRGWDDVIFRRGDRDGRLDRRDIGDVLGSVIFGRLDTRRRELGSRDDYVGQWRTTRSGRELMISAGGVPLARLIDRDGDRRVDGVYLAER